MASCMFLCMHTAQIFLISRCLSLFMQFESPLASTDRRRFWWDRWGNGGRWGGQSPLVLLFAQRVYCSARCNVWDDSHRLNVVQAEPRLSSTFFYSKTFKCFSMDTRYKYTRFIRFICSLKDQNQNQKNLFAKCVRHTKNLTWRLVCTLDRWTKQQ